MEKRVGAEVGQRDTSFLCWGCPDYPLCIMQVHSQDFQREGGRIEGKVDLLCVFFYVLGRDGVPLAVGCEGWEASAPPPAPTTGLRCYVSIIVYHPSSIWRDMTLVVAEALNPNKTKPNCIVVLSSDQSVTNTLRRLRASRAKCCLPRRWTNSESIVCSVNPHTPSDTDGFGSD